MFSSVEKPNYNVLEKSCPFLCVFRRVCGVISMSRVASFLCQGGFYLGPVMRKPAFCILCENKDADQLRGNREADQRLCFRYTDSTISLLPKSEISSL